jgi:iron complex transport system substrate-binding protein
LAIVLAALTLSACASSGSATSGGDATVAPGSGTAGTDGFPVTVPTKYGKVTIKQAPKRAVALTVAAADELISLGVTPVAVAVDPGSLQATYPWIVESIKDVASAKLVSPDGVPDAEAIAQTRPDLIVAETWQFKDKSAFQQLGQIAPTVIPDSPALNVDWDKRLLNVAAAVDKTADAEKIIADVRAAYAEVGAQVPGIENKTYQFVRADPDGFGFGNGSVLELFGLKAAANQDNTQNGPTLSKENTAHLDAELLGIWIPTEQLRASLDKDPLFQNLPAVKQGTVFYADLAVASAANVPAPMALDWLKDKLTPTIHALG